MKDKSVWKVWDENNEYGEVFYKRATGQLPEMESSKAAAKLIKDDVTEGDKILDVGCGSGHYLRSLRSALKINFFYTGVDATSNYINLGKRAFVNDAGVDFCLGDIYNLPFDENSFDIVMCNNVLLHLPSIQKPLNELIRVSKKTVLIRTLIGDRSFRIQDVSPASEIEFNGDGEPTSFYYYNIYSQKYLNYLLKSSGKVNNFQIIKDVFFDPQNIESSTSEHRDAHNVTKIIGDFQVNGYIIQPWKFLKINIIVPKNGNVLM
ncbi:methyltransferase domain-containing protein [Synechococcales cyanobacterium C]|uniref:Methyltransferase domain-containing protein n=1 Tax=Petrachloros mirabilis ULC683 TaxID=2781853 RepID=A0A8K1ZZY4_9CYAN|nr:class I SAM-dependent methyltransferase [Petrachloros mirabilis]NCJ07073.1 methyltransferase domain-containing protein [Petrachloros mirabilis ULC683]